MSDNIYQPPTSDIEVDESHRGSPTRAILAGLAVDLFGSLILGVAISVGYAAFLASQGLDEHEIQSALANVDAFTPLWFIGTALGLGITVFAGFVCAAIVNYEEYRYCTILGIISCTFAFIFSIGHHSSSELAGILILTIASCQAGAWLHIRRKHAKG